MKSKFALAAALTFCLSRVCFADVTGKVTLDGTPPDMKPIDMSAVKECAAMHPDAITEDSVVTGDKGELKNVVVSLKLAEDQEIPGKVPTEKVVLDQQGCMFAPHVVAMMVGQGLLVKNSDPFLHNVDSASTAKEAANKFNKPTLKGAEFLIDPQPKAPEIFRVKCDVHPWMSAWVAVFDHPYFAVSDDAGAFTIKNLPDGTYTLQAWHEKFGTQEQKITVKDGKATADFKFDVNAKPAPAQKKKIVMLTPPACPACAAKG